MSRNICITSAEGNTAFSIAKLLLTTEPFKKEIGQITGLALNPNTEYCQQLQTLGAKITQHKPGRVRDTVKILENTKSDTLMLIPPAHANKIDITMELIEAAKRANIQNVCFMSAAGCDLADRDAQPRLREFIDLEALFMKLKGDEGTKMGPSSVIIR
jgi:hypothetical protein